MVSIAGAAMPPPLAIRVSQGGDSIAHVFAETSGLAAVQNGTSGWEGLFRQYIVAPVIITSHTCTTAMVDSRGRQR